MGVKHYHLVSSRFYCDGACCASSLDGKMFFIGGDTKEENEERVHLYGWSEIDGKWYAPGHAPDGESNA